MKKKRQKTTVEFLSSQETEQSEIQKRVIELGKLIVNDLKLEPGVNTLSKWMAYYIAEQIENVENKTGKDKEEAERICFDSILKLWQNHSVLPNGHRPFEKFEPILRTLIKLDPNNSSNFYFDLPINIIKKGAQSETYDWINFAEQVDKYAKSLIYFSLKETVKHATDDKTVEYLNNTINLTGKIDAPTIVVRYLRNGNAEEPSEEKTNKINKELQEFKKIINNIQKKLNS